MGFRLPKTRTPSSERQEITLTNRSLVPDTSFHQDQMATEVWPVLNLCLVLQIPRHPSTPPLTNLSRLQIAVFIVIFEGGGESVQVKGDKRKIHSCDGRTVFTSGREAQHFLGEMSELGHSRETHTTALMSSLYIWRGWTSSGTYNCSVWIQLKLYRPSFLCVCSISSSKPPVAPAEAMTLDGFLLNENTWTGWKREKGVH